MIDIKNWLTSQMDFAEGCALLKQHCKNKLLVNAICSSTRNAAKLQYELKKLAGIPLEVIFNQKGTNAELLKSIPTEKARKGEGTKARKQKAEKPKLEGSKDSINRRLQPTDHAPTADPIAQAKEYLKDLHIEIDKMHKQLHDLGDSNTPAIIKKRAKILKKRIPIIKLADELYQLKEQYFKTNIIDDRLLQILSKRPKRKNH